MQIADLKGRALDKAVAKLEGVPADSPLRRMAVAVGSIPSYYPRYSTDWTYGGPIVERERINLLQDTCKPRSAWIADIGGWMSHDFIVGDHRMTGPTPLIAAMRCFVASRFGEEVTE